MSLHPDRCRQTGHRPFAGSTEGAHRACVLLGIVATCRAPRVPVEAYLAWAFERLGTYRDVFALPIEELTPAAFKKTLGCGDFGGNGPLGDRR